MPNLRNQLFVKIFRQDISFHPHDTTKNKMFLSPQSFPTLIITTDMLPVICFTVIFSGSMWKYFGSPYEISKPSLFSRSKIKINLESKR